MASVLLPCRGYKSSTVHKQLQWVGMTPLEWIESLASVSEEPKFNNTAFSSTPTRGSNPEDANSKPSPIPSWVGARSYCSPHQFLKPSPPYSLQSKKEWFIGSEINVSRDFPDQTPSNAMLEALPKSKLVITRSFPPHQMPLYWDLSALQEIHLFDHIRCLVLAVESAPNFPRLRLPFERTRDHFIYSIRYIRNNYVNPRLSLDMLYHELIHKLEALINLSLKLQQEQPTGAIQPFEPSPRKKSDLTRYLTQWLRDNWTNPYPDEPTLQEMAEECGSHPTVVGNWLINARTRKWRPAIVKAYNLNRSADLLLEDSINIYSGLPVRIVEKGSPLQDGSPSKRPRLS